MRAAKRFTIGWGVLAVAFATFGATVDNLIQAVNVLGSIFYGPMLGVFLLGFFFKRVTGTPAFFATLAAQALVLVVWQTSSIGFLWYNVIGCAAVIGLGSLFELARPRAAGA
jgi:Na+/proline symporter